MVEFVTSDKFFDRSPWMLIQHSFLSAFLTPPWYLTFKRLDREEGDDDSNYCQPDNSERTGFNHNRLISHFSLWIRESLSENILWPKVRLAPDAKQE